jgi:hypothetical protein
MDLLTFASSEHKLKIRAIAALRNAESRLDYDDG